MFRLVRGTGHILDVLVLHHDHVAPGIHDGAFSERCLRDPGSAQSLVGRPVTELNSGLRAAYGVRPDTVGGNLDRRAE
ncbi:hypothetical protein M2163_000500 [Streptomyces sp. SAI-135]|jgi:hypothetical protein|uniref:hypothetical protein n=1 Tax=unclassified Streptomyces TaxID=2593676 RepID=UPI0024747F4E|nr:MULTISPECIES: hypothetical protein [unclassified Streptomyces]MDH6522995.1 hypothetical protein [Streptomyces sp. SAI-090]MDH6554613.1 hypothetical protein [Streptomyces sp. SAI-041]MDH6573878.1 hypothetical protein [Streptomyces sp. SAI-117]MDH6581386.1 hypothetical protein [Streptomyces sp. SAI-133]MDH6613392.1 hypothetical protein [Streptomyces sp. SAI-135]